MSKAEHLTSRHNLAKGVPGFAEPLSDNRARRVAANVSIVTTLAFFSFLVVLHFIRNDLDPSWHFISEYELGPFGWIMQTAFCVLAVANLALLYALHFDLKNMSGWIALILFGMGPVGLILGGLFVPDPVNTSAEEFSRSGMIHNLGGALGLPSLIGSFMISVKLWLNPEWRTRRNSVLLASTILMVAFLISFIGIATLAARSNGVFGPETPVGWPNRIGVAGGSLWVMILGHLAKGQSVAGTRDRLDAPEVRV